MSAFKSLAVIAACVTQLGCAHLDVQLANFMTPDRDTRSAKLPAGYTVENRVISRGAQAIGITYAHHRDSRSTILFCGGDTFHRSTEGGEALEALALEADVVLFDYPGYGDTTGAPSTESILDTAAAVYDYVFGLSSAAGKKRLLYGFSLGGMVAAHLAQDRRADGLVLEATPPNVARWARSRIPLPLKPIVRVRLEPQLAGIDSVTALEQFPGKVLLLASRGDQIVPGGLALEIERQLRQAHRDVRLIEFPNRAHGTILRSPAYAATLRNFFEQVRPLP
jgi:pimeloyl-ACP methyl ester carboxylesterase